MTKIMLGKRPGRPEGTETLGLTTELWNYLTACWRQKPEDRITISKVLTLLKSMWVLPLIEDQTIGVLTAEP